MDERRALGNGFAEHPDSARAAGQAALWGAIEAEGLLAQAICNRCGDISSCDDSLYAF
jgi:hypothetical protein